MEYKILEKQEAYLMKEHIEDDDMVYNIEEVIKFINDENTIGFIAKENNYIAGFAYGHKLLHPDGKEAFFLYSIDMSLEYQNKGYGTQLLAFIKDYVKSIGCFEMFVITDKGNRRACHIYEKLGGKNDYDDEICYVYNLEIGDK